MRIFAAIYSRLRPSKKKPSLTPEEIANLSTLVHQFRQHSHNTPLPPQTLSKLAAARQLALQHQPQPYTLPLYHSLSTPTTHTPAQSTPLNHGRFIALLILFSITCALFTYSPSDEPTPYSAAYLDYLIDIDQLDVSPYFHQAELTDTPLSTSPN